MRAEIPDVSNKYLRSIVLHHMMHGPCGVSDPQCSCMVMQNGKPQCKHHYPWEFLAFTTHADDGYPTYRRRNTGETVRVRKVELDNRWVIPYNPYLLAYFDCHINVKVA